MKRSARDGFTLVEIMIVVAIVGLLAVIAVPSFVKARHDARRSNFVNDLRLLCDGINLVAMNDRNYPADTTPGIPPSGLSNYVQRVDWSRPTPIGGQWDWDGLQFQFGGRAGISVYRPDWSDSEMTEIDRCIDDGDLDAGAFRRRSQGFIYLIEK